MPSEVTLDLAARGLRQSPGANQQDLTRRYIVFPSDCLANSGEDFPDCDLLPVRAFDFLHDDQLLFVVLIVHGERGATVSP
jgi:hypothetical protein